ncbi:filamin ABP280 repeat-containing, putative [Babesia ovis]|uniref:Filamin ABP280 repeat-containing, putative n=1 Tax=Babesia ovis TaxID=5869 RepID=A0A9W5TB46_BABOV|nr:filamin ABP280 repeat-containing, putative [Babesia ovis]
MAVGIAKRSGAYARTVNVVPLPDTTYVEGEGIYGGECGKWVKFVVRKQGSISRGVIRLNLDYAEDACFKSSVFINHKADERDLQRNAPSCHNSTLANNSVADALGHNFLWDVCVVDGHTFNVRYRVTRKGTFLLHVKLDGNPIPGSPFRIYISDAPPHTAACRVYGRNLDTCSAIPYVPEIVEAIFPDTTVTSDTPKHVALQAGRSKANGYADTFDKYQVETPKHVNGDHAGSNMMEPLKSGGMSKDQWQNEYDAELGLGCDFAEPAISKGGKNGGPTTGSDKGSSPASSLRWSPLYEKSPCSNSATTHIGETTPSKRTPKNRSDDIGWEDAFPSKSKTRLVSVSDRHSVEYLQKRKQYTLDHLDNSMLLNEIEVHLADEYGNTVTHALPYVRAWGENYVRVVGVDYGKKGVIVIKYIVIVTREGLPALKEAQTRGSDSALPSSLQVGQVPCKINVEINGEPVFGSPFRPRVNNVEDLEQYYQLKLGTVESIVHRFTEMVNKNEFDKCADLYNSVKSPEAKEKLGSILVNKLSELEKGNIYVTSDIRLVESLKLQSLGRLLALVHNQYKKMLNYKTSSILHCIRELKDYEKQGDATSEQGSDNSKKFNNLGDVILNYRLIGDELRKLHRYELADRFDQINDQMCDEIDLGMWSSIIGQKEKRVQKLRTEVDTALDRLSGFKAKIEDRYSKFGRKDLNEFRHLPGFSVDQSVQTEPDDLITARLSHLIKGRCMPAAGHSDVDGLVEAYWRKCNNYDIQATVTKVLKSSVRLKNSISELFVYYSTTYNRDSERPVLGISRASMELFVLEAMLNNYLTANVKKLDWLFERFSIVLPQDGDGNAEITSPVRVIPEHMWCAYLRELGYLNLLYTIAESGDRELLRDHQHPSRLVAFHHICKQHLIPLYDMLFTTKPEFQKCIKFPNENQDAGAKNNKRTVKKVVTAPAEHYFRSRQDILNYFNVRALEHVLDLFNVDVLYRIFKHYSRVSMYGRQPVPKDWFNDNATISSATFVIFARDFQIIPGHMDGERVHNIARSVASRGQAGANKLGFRDFLNATSRTIARAVLAACLAKHDAYESQRDTLAETLDNVPRCVQSKESVKRDMEIMVQTLGLCDDQFVRFTIDAIYGAEAVEYTDGVVE